MLLHLIVSETLPSSAARIHRFESVDPQNPECISHILQLTRCLALRRFAGRWDKEDCVNDSVSRAWELAQLGRGTPATVAYFAIRNVASNGQFSRSRRSIDHTQPGRKAKQTGDCITSSVEPDPATLAVMRVDFEAWLDQLPSRLQRVAILLATGLNTVDIAQIIGCTRGDISGIRKQLIVDYSLFHDGTAESVG